MKFKLLLLVCLLASQITGQDPCTVPSGKPTCVCQTENGYIDLTDLASYGGYPAFQYIIPTDGNDEFIYSYNPCTGYSEGEGDGGNCNGVSACQTDNYSYMFWSLGDPSTETIYINSDTGEVYVQYTNGDDGRITKVYLQCDETATTPSITADGDREEELVYIYHLTSKCACAGGCSDDAPPTDPPTNDHPGGGSSGKGVAVGPIGIVLMLLVLAVFITYIVAGAIVLNKKYEKTGADMIPQRVFWFALPGLVKDGFIFTFSPIYRLVKGKIDKRRGGYETIE